MTSNYVKILLIVLALLYILMPYDLLADFFIGWGWLDDLIIAWLLWKYLLRPWLGPYFGMTRTQANTSQSTQRNNRHSNYRSQSAYSNNDQKIDPDDPFQVLGIDTGASPDEIKQAYRQLANKYHPDKVAHLGEEFRSLAEIRFKQIQEAYQKLSPK